MVEGTLGKQQSISSEREESGTEKVDVLRTSFRHHWSELKNNIKTLEEIEGADLTESGSQEGEGETAPPELQEPGVEEAQAKEAAGDRGESSVETEVTESDSDSGKSLRRSSRSTRPPVRFAEEQAKIYGTK